ncbi:hypothetical protein PAXRUDRAFT_676929 [Paxillus rubicundulus Ve08.2h10]|uniref:Uncharacterized protein n=1 Tax=Paxillus rubicundulus Ve08.2h10 TaxID=930991 RepID=A0A0D0BJF0_9AGAM|nr:hypothetical protein PAXRUDRAFT_676929 [Paxillus rubicundulus Ve08.2h10]
MSTQHRDSLAIVLGQQRRHNANKAKSTNRQPSQRHTIHPTGTVHPPHRLVLPASHPPPPTIPLKLPNKPIPHATTHTLPISTYSTLTNALSRGTGVQERYTHPQQNISRQSTVLTYYDPKVHQSIWSSLAGALGS